MNNSELFELREIPCPVCANNNPKFLGWRGGEAHHAGSGIKTAIVRCKKCSHQYPNPMPFPKIQLGELYTNAEEYFQGQDVETKKQNGLKLLEEFERRLGRRGRFLDVGCGVGEFLWAAKELGWEYEGVDPSSEFVEHGRKFLGVEGKVMLLEEANFPDNSFDAVTMSSIVEHLYNPYETLREIKRVLRPEGLLWFDAPNENGLYMKMGNLYMRLQRRDWVVVMAPTFPPYHVQGFNPSSIRSLLQRAGFQIEELEITGGVADFTGEQTFRKRLEHKVSLCINWLGKRIGMSSYMSIWAKKARDKKS